jgi:hypothetical protein
MKFEKIIASLMVTLTTLMTLVYPVLAAVPTLGTLASTPSTVLGKPAEGFYIVIGKDAKAEDVAGAADIAVRLAELSYEEKNIPGVSAAVNGLERDDVGLNDALSVLPGSGVLKNFHYTGLKDSTFSWRGSNYDYHEDVNVAGVKMRHEFAASNINGTEKMEFQTSGDVLYEYVFDKALSGIGTATDPNYSYPVNVNLLGKPFALVGSSAANELAVLQGSVCVDDKAITDKVPCIYGKYYVYATVGGTNVLRVAVWEGSKDTGSLVSEGTIMNVPNFINFDSLGISVRVTSVAALTEGTVIGANVIVGPIGSTLHTYKSSADVSSSDPTVTDRFSGETDWGIQVSGFTTAGTIPAGAKIQVVYKPTETVYKLEGDKLSLPNNYGELGFEGFNTDKFALIKITPVTSKAVYDSSDNLIASGLNGFEIYSESPASSVGSASATSAATNWYTKGYLLFNETGVPVANNGTVMVGFYDDVKGRIIGTTTLTSFAQNQSNTVTSEYLAANMLAFSSNSYSEFTYPFRISYGGVGDTTFYLNFTIRSGTTTNIVQSVVVSDVTMLYQNKSVWTSANVPEFQLGASGASTEETEVTAVTEGGTADSIGKSVQNVVADSGIIVVSPSANGGSEIVRFKAPSKALKVKVYFGTLGSTTTSQTYKAMVSVTSMVAKLDSDVSTLEKAKNLIVVGGACANSVAADALNVTFKTFPACAAGISSGTAIISLVASPYNATGKVVLVVAGYAAENTRAASSVVQQYSTLLAGVNKTSVVVTGTTVNAAAIS